MVATPVVAAILASTKSPTTYRRIAAAFDWHGVVASANYRIDAWVTPPAYTGRPPQILPIYDERHWKIYPKARAADLARFLALARKGQPYEKNMVVEDLQGRTPPPQFAEAIKFQQREHMERSIDYARKALDLGIRWRS